MNERFGSREEQEEAEIRIVSGVELKSASPGSESCDSGQVTAQEAAVSAAQEAAVSAAQETAETAVPLQNIDKKPEGKSEGRLAGKILDFINSVALICGQIFVVSVAACSTGCLASSLFNQSYNRVMYHCGPQDTMMGVFICLALPFYWFSWYFPSLKRTRLAMLATLGAFMSYMIAGVISGTAALIAGLLCFLLFVLFAQTGAHLASYRENWPRSFSVTRWLALLYIPAIVLFAYEFINIDLNALELEKVGFSSLSYSAAAIAAFVMLPCFFASVNAGSKRFASSFGLSLIGQAPVLVSILTYGLLNAIMLCCFAIFGGNTLHDYFAATAGGIMEPDFDLASGNLSELVCKFVCSIIVLLAVGAGLGAGAWFGTIWNRYRGQFEK